MKRVPLGAPDYMEYAKYRFASHWVAVSTGCWEWKDSLTRNGYGRFYWNGQQNGAHRFAHEAFLGPIPKGYDVDHLCRNRKCVNPAHLEAVSRRENLLRGDTIPAKWAARTHCKNGHLFDDANTHRAKDNSRDCRTCWREAS